MTLTLLISEEVKYITYINPLVSPVAVCTTCCSGQSLPSGHLTSHVACSTAQSTVKDGKACAPLICPNSLLPFGGHAGKTPPSRSLRTSSFLFLMGFCHREYIPSMNSQTCRILLPSC